MFETAKVPEMQEYSDKHIIEHIAEQFALLLESLSKRTDRDISCKLSMRTSYNALTRWWFANEQRSRSSYELHIDGITMSRDLWKNNIHSAHTRHPTTLINALLPTNAVWMSIYTIFRYSTYSTSQGVFVAHSTCRCVDVYSNSAESTDVSYCVG